MEPVKTNKISQKNPKREHLKKISETAKVLQKTKYPEYSINEILLKFLYQPENKKEKLIFDSFNGWRKKGMRVKKGEKAFLIWGRKKEATRQENEGDESDSFKFFPLAYVFSNKQVENFKEPVHEDNITGFYDLEDEKDKQRYSAEFEEF